MLVRLRATSDSIEPEVPPKQPVAVTFVLMVCVTVALWFTRSVLPADFDAINFVLGVDTFNLALHQPHPPGAPVFIVLGKILVAAGLDPMDALLALSILGGAVFVGVWHRIFLMFVRAESALFGALVLALMPALWLSATQPMSDTLAMAGVAVTQWLVLLYWRERSEHLVLLAALAAAFALGIRPQLGAFMLVALIASILFLRMPLVTCLRAGAVFAAANLCWIVPAMVLQSQYAAGDVFEYFRLVASFGDEFKVASDSPMLSNRFELLKLWKRFVLHFGAMGYFGAGMSLWYPEVFAERLAGFGTLLTPIHADLQEWSYAGSALFALYAQGSLLALRRLRNVFRNRIAWYLLFFALLYVLSVLSLVPPHTRFYLPLLPLLAILPVVGYSSVRWSRLSCSLVVLVAFAALSSVIIDSQRDLPPPMALAQKLSDIQRESANTVHALLDSNGRRHTQYFAPDVVLNSVSPEENDVIEQWIGQGDRVFANSTMNLDKIREHFSVVPVAEFRRPLRVWMRHTGTTLFEIMPQTQY